MQIDLPEPGPAARAHSAELADHIRAAVAAAGGWIDFAHYMRLALYAPGLGYYSAGAAKFGADGDFVTAPEISPLFSRCLARQFAEVLQSLGGGDVLEPGAGSGVMAAEMLLEFERLGTLPERYLILEPSAELRERQQQRLAKLPGALQSRIEWLDTLPAAAFRGVIVANEVADALPVRRFLLGAEEIQELGVGLRANELVELAQSADRDFVAQIRTCVATSGALAPGYVSELCESLPAWIASLGECLDEGLLVLLDYGFSRREYYMPERRTGTLRCYFRHRAHDNALLWPGLQDITAWVDFTCLAEAAQQAGLTVDAYTTQAQFLLASGLESVLADASAGDPKQQATLASGLQKLILPGEMGDAVKLMALRKGNVRLPSGASARDMRARL